MSHLSRLGLQRMTLESGIPSDGDGQMRLGLQRMTPCSCMTLAELISTGYDGNSNVTKIKKNKFGV